MADCRLQSGDCRVVIADWGGGRMDPVVLIVVPGVVGGLAIALPIALQHRSGNHRADTFGESPSTDVINMARIRVAGIGGLGLIAMAASWRGSWRESGRRC